MAKRKPIAKRRTTQDVHNAVLRIAGTRFDAMLQGVMDDAENGDANGRKLIFDAIKLIYSKSIVISTPIPNVSLKTPQDIIEAQLRIAAMCGSGSLGLQEGDELQKLYQRPLDSMAALTLEQFRTELEELRKSIAGGGNLIEDPDSEPEIRPAWGRPGRNRNKLQ